MKSIKGTKTEQNLLKSFAGESQAQNRYTFFAKIAKKEGYEKVAQYFLETAFNESVHAKQYFKCLEGGEVEITASYPAGILSNTIENLSAAADGEEQEWEVLYPEFGRVAKEEGFDDISTLFFEIAEIEKHHMKRYRKLKEFVESGSIFKKETETEWRCRNCGHMHTSCEAPEMCTVCEHPKAYFEVYSDIF